MFAKGQQIKCIDNDLCTYLTKGKLYNVLNHSHNCVAVINDRGEIESFFQSRFKSAPKPQFKANQVVKCVRGDNAYNLVSDLYYRIISVKEQYGKVFLRVGYIEWDFDADRFEPMPVSEKPVPFLKKGDTVRCINVTCMSLIKGHTYKVRDHKVDDGKHRVSLQGLSSQMYFPNDWFEWISTPSELKPKFAVGQQIRCIDAKGTTLSEGQIYTVSRHVLTDNSTIGYNLEGQSDGARYPERRFISIKPATLNGTIKITDSEGNVSEFRTIHKFRDSLGITKLHLIDGLE